MSIKQKCKWTKVKQYAINKIKGIMARDTVFILPDFNGTFKIHTNASVLQLGEVISQKGTYIPLYSRKITDIQQRYTVTERELISIVESLKDL